MEDRESKNLLERALGPTMGPWQLLRFAAAILVLASLAGVTTRFLPPAQGRTGGVEGAGGITLFFALHALAWVGVFLFASRRARRAEEQRQRGDGP
jgi:hypothetical protein